MLQAGGGGPVSRYGDGQVNVARRHRARGPKVHAVRPGWGETHTLCGADLNPNAGAHRDAPTVGAGLTCRRCLAVLRREAPVVARLTLADVEEQIGLHRCSGCADFVAELVGDRAVCARCAVEEPWVIL